MRLIKIFISLIDIALLCIVHLIVSLRIYNEDKIGLVDYRNARVEEMARISLKQAEDSVSNVDDPTPKKDSLMRVGRRTGMLAGGHSRKHRKFRTVCKWSESRKRWIHSSMEEVPPGARTRICARTRISSSLRTESRQNCQDILKSEQNKAFHKPTLSSWWCPPWERSRASALSAHHFSDSLCYDVLKASSVQCEESSHYVPPPVAGIKMRARVGRVQHVVFKDQIPLIHMSHQHLTI